MTVLQGVRIVEIAGIGPGPFCGMLLADLGAEVITVERQGSASARSRTSQIVNRGKLSIAVDLKKPEAVDVVLRLLENADALIEGMRPGVMERLGLGPEVCLARRPSLVYGRMTGWGQVGPLAHAAGHDSNYTALSGALWYSSPPGQAPVAPPTLVGDIGGGAMYLAVGLLAGIMKARASGRGQIVDAAIVDGTAHMMNLMLGALSATGASMERGKSLLDGPHWAMSYRCRDDKWINLASLEPEFYAELLRLLDLDQDPRFDVQMDINAWPAQRTALAEIIAKKSQAEWCSLLEGTDACFAPVLDLREAADHPHLKARGVYAHVDGVLQARAAPRFSVDEPGATVSHIPALGEHMQAVLTTVGYSAAEITALRATGVV